MFKYLIPFLVVPAFAFAAGPKNYVNDLESQPKFTPFKAECSTPSTVKDFLDKFTNDGYKPLIITFDVGNSNILYSLMYNFTKDKIIYVKTIDKDNNPIEICVERNAGNITVLGDTLKSLVLHETINDRQQVFKDK